MRKNVVFASVLLFCGCVEAGAPESGLAAGSGEVVEALGALHPTPVESVEELPGRYYRPYALPGQLSYLQLGFLEEGEGRYRAWRACGVPACLSEIGTYVAVPENPAIGFAFLGLSPSGGDASDHYRVNALWRNGSGTLVALELQRVVGNVFGPPFYLYRTAGASIGQPMEASVVTTGELAADAEVEAAVLGLTNELGVDELVAIGELDPELAEAVVAARAASGVFLDLAALEAATGEPSYAFAGRASCAYYRDKSLYYRIRALQCAYSYCYPLSSWYGYWAEYYAALAEKVCPPDDPS